jgi:hypothetical protein
VSPHSPELEIPVRISFAHIRERSTAGSMVDFAVFDAKSTSGSDAGNAELLASLTTQARLSGLKIDQSALAFVEQGQVKFYGARPLVEYLSRSGVPSWTHFVEL